MPKSTEQRKQERRVLEGARALPSQERAQRASRPAKRQLWYHPAHAIKESKARTALTN